MNLSKGVEYTDCAGQTWIFTGRKKPCGLTYLRRAVNKATGRRIWTTLAAVARDSRIKEETQEAR